MITTIIWRTGEFRVADGFGFARAFSVLYKI